MPSQNNITAVKKYRKAMAKLAILAFALAALNVVTDVAVSIFDRDPASGYRASYRRSAQESDPRHQTPSYNNAASVSAKPPPMGYFNLSCPFEWSKYSCAHMQRHMGKKGPEVVRASTEYYLRNYDKIRTALEHAAKENERPKRIFFAGDSLMRQLFIGIACNALSALDVNVIESAAMPWKEEWPCKPPCLVTGGVHSGFDAASIRLVNGLELHFVPHMGFVDEHSSETDVLERLERDIANYGRVTFGEKTAMPPGRPEVDVLVYNVGIHYGLGQARKMINQFANRIAKPLMENANNSSHVLDDGGDGYEYARTKRIYVTTPAQHYGTSDGQWGKGMTPKTKQCVESVKINPRAELEKELLKPGVNVDVLLDYDDLNLGNMHIVKNHDCSHYCMPGVPDVVGARLLEEILA